MADVTLTIVDGSPWTATQTGTITVECWGGGAAGGGSNSAFGGGGGGGGGAYSKTTNISVTKDTTYAFVIGTKGTGGSDADGNPGGDTTWQTNVCVADGG